MQKDSSGGKLLIKHHYLISSALGGS